MTPVIVKLTTTPSKLGEGPHWDEKHQCLYFVDITGKYIQKYDPKTNETTKAKVDGSPSIIIPVEDHKDHFLISKDKELEIIKWDGHSEHIHTIEKVDCKVDEGKNTKFNDGKCDPYGRLWIGTMDLNRERNKWLAKDARQGSLVSCLKGTVTRLNNVGISNGIAFDLRRKKLYFIDTDDQEVVQFDFDIETGAIRNKTTIFTFSKHDLKGAPDGMTIDTDGNLWVANIFGGKILKIHPAFPETLLKTIAMPVEQPTSLAFGGPNLDELYVTTGDIRTERATSNPNNGHLYKITGLDVKGFPAKSVHIHHFVYDKPDAES